jgi:hypothetical protein
VAFDTAKSGFAKKTNTGTKIFIAIAIIVGVAIIAYLVNVVLKSGAH